METSFYALEDFAVGELVLVRNVNRKEPWWPVCVNTCCATERHLAKHYMLHVHFWAYSLQAIVLDPIKEAPETVRRQMQPDRLCVMYYGPPANKVWRYCSVSTL